MEKPANPTTRMLYVLTTVTSLAQEKTFAVVRTCPFNPCLPRLTIHFSPRIAPDYVCYRDAAGSPKCRVPGVTSTRNASGNGFSSTPRPTSTSTIAGDSIPGDTGGSSNSAISSKTSLGLFSITPLLGWIGKSFRAIRLYCNGSLTGTP